MVFKTKFLLLILVSIQLISFILNNNYRVKNENIRPINDEQYADFLNDLRTGEHVDLHKYMLKYVINPGEADLNKDRKISANELKKVLEYIVLPKSSELKETVGKENINASKASINLFVSQFEPPYTYSQFIKILYVLKVDHLADVDRVQKNVEASKLGVELTDDL